MGAGGGWERGRVIPGRRTSLDPGSHGESEAEGTREGVNEKWGQGAQGGVMHREPGEATEAQMVGALQSMMRRGA